MTADTSPLDRTALRARAVPVDGQRFLRETGVPDLPLARAWSSEQLRAAGICDDVSAAVVAVPRHGFVPRRWRVAYLDLWLLDDGMWIPPPSAVARVAAALPRSPTPAVLELDPGSGYQTAVLAACGAHVTTIAASPQVRHRLRLLGLSAFHNDLIAPPPPDTSRFDGVVATARHIEQLHELGFWLGPAGGVIIAGCPGAGPRDRLIRHSVGRHKAPSTIDLGEWPVFSMHEARARGRT